MTVSILHLSGSSVGEYIVYYYMFHHDIYGTQHCISHGTIVLVLYNALKENPTGSTMRTHRTNKSTNVNFKVCYMHVDLLLGYFTC